MADELTSKPQACSKTAMVSLRLKLGRDAHAFPTLLIAILSILLNEVLFYYTKHIAEKIQSALLLANSWHHRSDSASSLVVSLGVLGSLLGFTYLDKIAAIIVGLMIIHMGFQYAWDSVKELVDTAVSAEQLQEIISIIKEVAGVKKIHQLRSRMMAGHILIDVHIQVDPKISVSEGHYIAQHVHRNLMAKISSIKDVTVHIDPEDDEIACPSLHLPNRLALEEQLLKPWQQEWPTLDNWQLHYIDGKLIIDLFFKDNINLENIDNLIQKDLKNWPMVEQVNLYIQLI